MRKVSVLCSHCGKPFERTLKRANENKKKGWKTYCSARCLRLSRVTRVQLTCDNPKCKKSFSRNAGGVGRFNYCSNSCAAEINNRKRSLSKRKRNSSKQEIKYCANPNCNKLIPPRNKYCSNKCQGEVTRRTVDEYKEEVVAAIRRFYEKHNRIPVRRETWALYRKARKGFGTWNNAVKAAGYEPNPVLFAKKYIANDGHKCDSLSEKIIDDWLFARKISHEIHVLYEETSMTADFKVGGVLIEFLGLVGEVRRYDQLLEEKRGLWKERNLKVIEVYPKDIFPKSHLDKVLKRLTTV